MRRLVRGGRVVDPSQGLDARLDVLIEDGAIARLDEQLDPPAGAEIVEAEGRVVVPGLIDSHVHLREPGHEQVETLEQTLRAAALGGFTAVVVAADTEPAGDHRSVLEHLRLLAGRQGWARLYPMGCLSKQRAGEELAELGELAGAGAVAVSDSPRSVASAELLRRALQYARHYGLPVVERAEEGDLAAGGQMHEGEWSTRLGLAGIPALAEDVAVARALLLAEATGGRLHLAHLSTARSLAAVRAAKSRGLAVSCDVTPYHLLLADREVAERRFSTALKLRPPLRPESDVQALLEGLGDGTVDVIASGHTAHHPDVTDVQWNAAPFGVSGLMTTLAVCLDRLVRPGVISLARLIDLLACSPARIFGLSGGSLAAGRPADLTLIDLEHEHVVSPESWPGAARSTPFAGWVLRGKAVLTMVGGNPTAPAAMP